MTLREIAEAAEVSIGTVDRVLHNRGRVSPATKAKIEMLISEHGYRPNPIARHLKLNKKYSFAVILPNMEDDSGYWKLAYKGIQKAAKELEAFGVGVERIRYDRYDTVHVLERIQEQIDDLNFDGLLMAPVLPAASYALIKTLPADFPIIFFDAQLPDFQPLSRIGQDAFQSGVLAGRLLDAFSTRKGPYCVVSAHSEDYHIRKRIEGFFHYFESLDASLAADPDRRGLSTARREVRIFECFDLDHRDTRESFLRTMLKETESPGGVFVTNASVHGVAAHLNRKGSEHIAVLGYDLVPENEQQLRLGTIDCLLSQRPEYQAYEALYQLYSHVVLQQVIEKQIIVPIDIYVRENLP